MSRPLPPTAPAEIDVFVSSVAERLRSATAATTPEVLQALRHMDLTWAPIYSDVLYHAVREGAPRLSVEPGALYDAILERAALGPAPRTAALDEEERDERYRLDLFRTVLGWKLQRVVTAPPSFPERAERVAPLEREPRLPRVTVVILSCNRLEYLRNTLCAFHRTVEHGNCELVVLDNASTDGSRELLERALELGLVSRLVLAEENLGNAKGFNVACAHADRGAALVVKLDSDICPLSRGWDARMLALAQADPRVGLIGLLQLNHHLLRTAPSVEVAGEAVIPWSTWAVGSCMAITRAAFDRLGYFSEPAGLKYSWDDVDYWMRATRAGFAGWYLRDAVAAHQTILDASLYRSAAGPRDYRRVRAALRRHGRAYDTGERELSSFPPEYRDLGCGSDRRVVWSAA
jgi:GT2 family glycosyltransferase